MTKAVLTIATGKKLYLDMAAALARSFRLWNRDNGVDFILATDQPSLIPPDLDWVNIHVLRAGEYGEGFSPKLHIDKMSHADATLYIDADCLCAGSLEAVFETFKGKAVSAIGKNMTNGEWFGDISDRRARFSIDAVPVFVGATYYFEKGEVAKTVFEDARRLEAQYDEIGLVRLRDRPNEEPLISLGMALNGEQPVPDDGMIKADAMHFPDQIAVNVFKGKALFANTSGHVQNTSPSVRLSQPVIAHFNDSYAHQLPYTREARRLEAIVGHGHPQFIGDAYAAITESLPKTVMSTCKDTLRPIYRKVFGVRRVKQNVRV